MSEAIALITIDAEETMSKAIGHLEQELTRIRAGKATPGLVDGIHVEYYGAPTLISQVANITVLDARTISIQPWEKTPIRPQGRCHRI
jgi:ribosome recycling factor